MKEVIIYEKKSGLMGRVFGIILILVKYEFSCAFNSLTYPYL